MSIIRNEPRKYSNGDELLYVYCSGTRLGGDLGSIDSENFAEVMFRIILNRAGVALSFSQVNSIRNAIYLPPLTKKQAGVRTSKDHKCPTCEKPMQLFAGFAECVNRKCPNWTMLWNEKDVKEEAD